MPEQAGDSVKSSSGTVSNVSKIQETSQKKPLRKDRWGKYRPTDVIVHRIELQDFEREMVKKAWKAFKFYKMPLETFKAWSEDGWSMAAAGIAVSGIAAAFWWFFGDGEEKSENAIDAALGFFEGVLQMSDEALYKVTGKSATTVVAMGLNKAAKIRKWLGLVL